MIKTFIEENNSIDDIVISQTIYTKNIGNRDNKYRNYDISEIVLKFDGITLLLEDCLHDFQTISLSLQEIFYLKQFIKTIEDNYLGTTFEILCGEDNAK